MAHGYSVDLRERAVGYVHRGGRRSEACKIFQVGASTLDRWLRQHRETNDLHSKPNGSRAWKLGREAIVSYVKNNNDSTLQEVADHFGTVVSAIDYVLRKFNITRKKPTLYAERDEVKRAQFLAGIEGLDSRRIVYIDESGVEDTLFRQYARAPRGSQVLTDIKGQKNRTI